MTFSGRAKLGSFYRGKKKKKEKNGGEKEPVKWTRGGVEGGPAENSQVEELRGTRNDRNSQYGKKKTGSSIPIRGAPTKRDDDGSIWRTEKRKTLDRVRLDEYKKGLKNRNRNKRDRKKEPPAEGGEKAPVKTECSSFAVGIRRR